MIIIWRILRTTLQNIFRHGLASLTAVLIITLLFLLFNGVIFASFAQSTAVQLINEQLELALPFQKPVDEFQVNSLKAELQDAFPDIRTLTFISADEAFDGFLADFQSTNPDLADWLVRNSSKSPLPATLVISASASLHQPILDYLAAGRFADLLNLDNPATGKLATNTTNKILAFDQTLRQVSWLSTLAFGLLALLIIVAVLRLTIMSRQTEITIMRLTGATRQFIRLPFILEGAFFGAVAASLGTSVFFLLLKNIDLSILSGGYGELLNLATTNYNNSLIIVLGWQILAAVLVGVLASILATRRYLRRDLVLS